MIWVWALLLTATTARAQSKENSSGTVVVSGATAAEAEERVILRGVVYDNSDLKGMEAATIQLYKEDGSTFVKGDVTNSNGVYLLKNLRPAQYVVKVSFVGYDTQTLSVNLTGKKGIYRAKDILLKASSKMMQEAVVEGKIPEMEVVEDTTVYNAAAFVVPEGAMVEELVKKLPGVETDDSGNLTVNGKTVSKVLVDGKEFFGSDKDAALKNLPANIVDKVKVYDKKSDLTRITGIDDGNEETVIDLTVKKGMKQGWFGNLDAAYGTEDRYTEKLSVNRFGEAKRFTLMGSANNVNDSGFPGGGGGFRGGGGGGNGQNTHRRAGANFAFENSKLEMGGSAQVNTVGTDSKSWTNSQSFETRNSSYSNHYSNSTNKSLNFSFDYRLEWKPDTMTNILLRPTFNYTHTNNRSYGHSITFNQDPYAYVLDPLESYLDVPDSARVNRNVNSNHSKGDSYSGNFSLQVNRKLNNEGRNLTLNVGGGIGRNESESASYSQIDYYQLLAATGGDSIYSKVQYNDAPTKNHNWNVQLSYSEPIFYAAYLQFSYNFRYNYQNSDRTVSSIFNPLNGSDGIGLYNYEAYNNPLYYTLDTDQCRYVENRYYNHDIRLQLRMIRTKYNLSVGVSLQPQHSSTSYTKGEKHYDIPRTVFNWSPTAQFRYRFSKQEQFRFTYRGSSSQPSITDLIPDTLDNANPLSIRMGNPELDPSFTHNIRAEYNKSIRDLQRFFNTSFDFRTMQNSVSSMSSYDETTGGRVTKPMNINGNWNANFRLGFNTAMPFDTRFRFSTNSNVGYTNSVSYVYLDEDKSTRKNTAKNLNLNESLRFTYRTDAFEVTLNGSINYRHARNDIRTTGNLDTYTFAYGLSANWSLPWSMSISTNISENSRRGYDDATMNTNELLWNFQIAQRFLAKKRATISLQLYDILHQQSNVSRTISAITRSDMRYNTITSYAMLHFIYQLNLIGGKQGSGGSNRRGGDMESGFGGGRGGDMGGGMGGPGGGPM